MGTRSGSGGILGWEKSGGGGGGDYDEEQQEQEECDVGLGLRMQLNENNSDTGSSSSSSVFPNRKAAPGVSFHGATAAAHPHLHHHPYHHYFTGDYVGGSVHGNTSNLSQIYYMGLGGGGGTGNNLQVLDCFASGGSSTTKASKSLQHHPLSISGKMGESGNVRVPFTAVQWQELERQNMILKYMMASIPVPPELLLPVSTTKSFSNVVPTSRSGGDLEPWRCRRTDGKKWRCSRDVAPHQKYCERHSHKNRPRSRKPVELPAAAAATDYLHNPASKSTAAVKRSLASQPQHQNQPPVDSRQVPSSHFITTFDQDTPSGFPSSVAPSQPFDPPRCLDWFMKGETIPNQDWHPHQHRSDDMSMGLKGNATGCRRNNSGGSSSNMDPFQLKQASQYSVTPQHCSLLLMEGAVEPGHGQQTRRFIDAWSDVDEGGANRAISSYNPSSGENFDLPTSSLTLTMCGGEGDEYSLGSQRMGEKPHWMSGGMGHHGSWMGSPPGGPLAEALCLGSIGGGGGGGGAGCIRYQTSPRGCSSVTTMATSSRSSSKDEGQEELNFID